MSRKSKKKMKLRIRKNSLLSKLVIVAILLVIVLNILRYAAYFKKDDNSKLIVMIQNDTNAELVHDVYIDENNVIYFSEDDKKKYFDKELYYEKDESNLRRYISISQNKILEITEGKNNMYINSTFTKIKGSVISRDGVFYFPLSELTDVYNIDVEYIKDKNRLNIDKLDEEKNVATVNRDTKLKYKMTGISKTVENLTQGDKVTILGDVNQKWIKVKTKDYQIGYVKKSKLIDFAQERDNLELSIQDFTNFDLKNDIVIEINDSTYSDFNDKIADYETRTALAQEINSKVAKEITTNKELSSKNIGIKMNITSVSNNDNYYRFLKELKAYINSNGCFLIVVNQPNFDANTIKDIANVVV